MESQDQVLSREELFEELKILFNNFSKFRNFPTLKNNDLLVKSISYYTLYFKEIDLSERTYLFIHDLKEVPKCKCGKELYYQSLKKGYQKNCSYHCAGTGRKLKEESKNKIKESKKNAKPTTLGTTIMNNGINEKFVPKNKVQEYLNSGWILGQTENHKIINKKAASFRKLTKETSILMSKGNESRRIRFEEVDMFLKEGWTGGQTEERKEKSSVKSKNCIWITKDGVERFIEKYKLSEFLEEGWIKGRNDEIRKVFSQSNLGKPSWNKDVPMREESRIKLSNSLKNHYEVNTHPNKGKSFEEICGEERAQELKIKYRDLYQDKEGPLKNRISIIKDNTTKFIKEEELQKWIDKGWCLGGKKPSEDTRRKHRERVLNGLSRISSNEKACDFFKYFEDKLNWKNSRYGFYGKGEYKIIGYSLDFYNEKNKLIIEWDEDHHYDIYKNLRSEDIERQERIQKELPDFKFFRIRERDFLISKKPKIIDYEKCFKYIVENLELNF